MRLGINMPFSRSFARWCAPVVAVAMIASVPVAAHAAETGAFGSVDLGKIQAGYAKRGDLEKSIQDLGERLTAAMKQQESSDMLDAAHEKQLGDLLVKPNITDADRAAISKLMAQSSADATELAGLQQKQNLSDTDKSRLDFLTKERQSNKAAIDQLKADYTDQLRAQQDKVSTQFTDIVRQAIAAVAKEKSLGVVFDSTVAIWTANDITDDVLKRLNK